MSAASLPGDRTGIQTILGISEAHIRQEAATAAHRPPELADVVEVLAGTYKDPGIIIWLNSRNYNLGGLSPARLILDGRIDEVYEEALHIGEPPVFWTTFDADADRDASISRDLQDQEQQQ